VSDRAVVPSPVAAPSVVGADVRAQAWRPLADLPPAAADPLAETASRVEAIAADLQRLRAELLELAQGGPRSAAKR
jgi:hypothetical protein